MEFDAAQALLDLHNDIRETIPCNPCVESQMNHTDDVIKTANLYMSCFFTSNVRVEPSSRFAEANMSCYIDQINNVNNVSPSCLRNTSLITENNKDQYNMEEDPTVRNEDAKTNDPNCNLMRSLEMMLNKHLPKRFENTQVINNAYNINDLLKKPEQEKRKIKTRDIGIQTIETNQSYKIQIMEFTIKHLSDRIKALEAQISTAKVKSDVLKEGNKQIYKGNEENRYSGETSPRHVQSNRHNHIKPRTSNVNKSSTSDVTPCKTEAWRKEDSSCEMINKIESNDLVPIGKGRALVSARLLRHINWNSYTSATRKLLTAIFSRRVLATHSLTGKRSPAFPKKQPKKKLDVDLVQDIVQTVVDRCSVPENVVRTSITTKCADESKMYRTRMMNRRLKQRKTRENTSSETTDSDDSVN